MSESKEIVKSVNTPGYNWVFNKLDGTFIRWGRTYEEDPVFSPRGPEILDIEVSTICHGPHNDRGPCSHCYKGNCSTGKNMSIDTFKQVIDKLLPVGNLTQIAIGIGDIDANPDLWKMMEYARSNDIIPNITINGSRMTKRYFDMLRDYCGAVAVSLYPPAGECYNAVHELATIREMKQINIHCLVANETYQQCTALLQDIKTHELLKNLNCVVFLSLKQKGALNQYSPLPDKLFNVLVQTALEDNQKIGFDSCTSHKFMKCIKDHPKVSVFEMMVEPCESSIFSGYVNTEGRYWHCSFMEGIGSLNGIDMLTVEDFIKEVWNHEETINFRETLLAAGRQCPVYTI